MTKEIINGIDVSESVLTATNNDVYYSQNAVDELQNNIKRLQEENEELKAKIAKFRWDNPYYDLYNNVVGQRDNLKKENKYYKQALEEIKAYIKQECKNKQCPQTCANCFMGNVLTKVNEALNDRN